MEDYLEMFIMHMESINRSEETQKQYKREIEKFIEFLNEKGISDLEKIKTIHIDLYQSKLMKRMRTTSVNKSMAALKSFFKYLHTRKYIEENPIAIVEKVRIKDSDKKKKENLTVEEAERLIYSTEKNSIPSMKLRNKVLMMSFLFFGVRVSELCALKIEDVSFKEKTIYINDGKGGKNREVPMFDELIEDFKEYIKTRKGKEYLFSVKNTDKPLNPDSVLKLVKHHVKKARIKKNIGCHALRRTTATLLSEDDLDITEIQKFLGHSSINTTMLYLNTELEATKRKIRRNYSLAKKVKKRNEDEK